MCCFIDVTTLSFASDKSDELRKKGYSKDGKHNRVQVVLALMQTRDGLPVGYELFEGNTADAGASDRVVESAFCAGPRGICGGCRDAECGRCGVTARFGS